MSLCIHAARSAAALALGLAALSPLLTPMPARAQAASGVKVTVLHKAFSPSTLTVGADGSFFGTEDYYPGTIFKVTLGGLMHELIKFNVHTGITPSSGPLLALPDGSFFGSTTAGGKSNTGSLFLFTPKRRYQVKHEFASLSSFDSGEKNVRGANPNLPMALASDGAIYGTTSRGGSLGGGVIFRYTPAQGVQVVHNFTTRANTVSGLTRGPDGALYGTTLYSGSYGAGEIFRCTTTGNFTVLHEFTGADGAGPNGVPVVGPDGALYGTTEYTVHDFGVVYRITTDGDYTLLHTFPAYSAITRPFSPLVLGPDGKMYGTTEDGPQSQGAVYRVTVDGTVSVLYRNPVGEDNIGTDGTAPVFGRDNRLYVGGPNAIYKITVPF